MIITMHKNTNKKLQIEINYDNVNITKYFQYCKYIQIIIKMFLKHYKYIISYS